MRCWLGFVACLMSLGLPACGRLGFGEHAPKAILRDAGDNSDAMADATTRDDAGSLRDAGLAANSCALASNGDYCNVLPHLDQRPVIDGKLDCALPLHSVIPQGWTGLGPIPSDHKGTRAAIAWHEEGVYFYVEVSDSSHFPAAGNQDVWCGDAIEAYVDSDGQFPIAPAYDDPGAIQLISAIPANAAVQSVRGGASYRNGDLATKRPWSTSNHATYFRPDGYVFEAFVTAEDLDLPGWSLRAGDQVGVDISADVSLSAAAVAAGQVGDCGTRAGQYFLRIAQQNCTGTTCTPYLNIAGLCTPVLR
jgi:hypothetical protein